VLLGRPVIALEVVPNVVLLRIVSDKRLVRCIGGPTLLDLDAPLGVEQRDDRINIRAPDPCRVEEDCDGK